MRGAQIDHLPVRSVCTTDLLKEKMLPKFQYEYNNKILTNAKFIKIGDWTEMLL